jgi:hypothetical protein
MSQINGYSTLSQYKIWMSTRGLSGTPGADTSDDAVITQLIEAASRYTDNETGRKFYPAIETRLYDVPYDGDERQLLLDNDLLEVLTLTNGDTTVLTTTDYFTVPRNTSPKFAIQLKDISGYWWEADSNGSSQGVISVFGYWGYHREFSQRAWKSVGTTNSAVNDTTTASFSCTTGHTVLIDTIVKINNEIMQVKTSGTNTIAVDMRGDNGSTAATHLTAQTVYEWQPMIDIKNAVNMIVDNVYASRSGQTQGGRISVTASGIVIRPEEVPAMAQRVINSYKRWG